MHGKIGRVLIADNHELIRVGVRKVLEARPALQVVVDASTGRSALEQARAAAPHLAIIDYTLSELNGLDLTHALMREIPNMQVLMFAMHDREDVVLSAFRAGARGYVRKSDPSEYLLAAVDALSFNRTYVSCGVSPELLEQALQTKQIDRGTLTSREREILQLIAEGRLNKQIANTLGISIKTVETDRSAAMHKLKCTNTAQLVRYALRNDIVAA